MSIMDGGNQAEATAPAWLHLLPVLSSEQAVSLQEGQEIVGTRHISAAPTTSPRQLLPENNVTNSACSKGGAEVTKEETGEQ